MKRIFLYISIAFCFLGCNHKDLLWTEVVDDLDGRVTKLEELCKEMNTNITSLQTIVDVLQSNDYITGIVEIKKDGKVIGYTITFGKHDPITIYHGQDGKDGQDGSSSTPVIGIAQDTDGVYYWTLNGEWLLDDNGNKLPVSGTNGKDGQNGSNGQDGTDGKDGVTPQLKIEDGYWYISYDNGATWTQLGKATGEDGKDGTDGKDGQNGTNGKDGQDGDPMFQSVTQDENYVYFTLADGTVIKIAKGSSNNQPNGSHNGYQYIDLGLPSGNKWAKENFDGYYCFGGLLSNNQTTTEIYIDGQLISNGENIAGTEYDIVTKEWGKGWEIPTKNDFQELINNCSVSYLSECGVTFKSNKNGKTIFFNFDVIGNNGLASSPNPFYWRGNYWTSTAYQVWYIEMKRTHHHYDVGYDQYFTQKIIDAPQNQLYLIRPVLK